MGAVRFAVALPVVVAAALYVTPLAAAATFTVNTNDDGDTVCTPAHCSLREAIKAANASPGLDLIAFAIPPGGPQSIKPVGRSLPAVTDPVTIDATTQAGYTGAPIVELDGSLAGPGAVGFDIPAGQSLVTGLVINGFGAGLGGLGTGYGIRLAGAGGTTIAANYIGTDPTGTAAPRQNDIGIFVDSTDNVIGGTTAARRNVISGNGSGVILRGAATRNTVTGNYIGTDVTGTQVVGLNSRGVEINNDVGANVIGGGNLISGNTVGVLIDFAGPSTVVQGNLIGTTASGLAALSVTGQTGVLVSSSSRIVIGGSVVSDRNVISGNSSSGVTLQGSQNVVGNNYIGVGSDGQTAVPNAGAGVQNDVGGNTIGVPFPGSSVLGGPNVIAFNGSGVTVRNGTSSPILGNSIYANLGLGIDLYPLGPNPNDPGDADTGPNELQNAPTLTSASTTAGNVTVDGSLSSQPNMTYLLEFFANASCDDSGFGEGQEFLADRTVTTDASGTATFSFTFGSGHVGNVITATATDPNANTSEFSNCTSSTPAVSGSVTTLSPANAVNTVGTSHTVTATVVGGTVDQPLSGVTVHFSVSGSVSTTGQCTTDQAGQCSFTYQGPSFPGADLITAYADANGNSTQDLTEVAGRATKEWVLPVATPGQATGGGQITWLTGKVVFGFNAQNHNGRIDGNCNVVDVASDLHIKCLSVTTLVVAATHATFFGAATVNRVATNYRIDVDDLGESGTNDTFKIQTDSGYVAAGTLTEGNIQVRP